MNLWTLKSLGLGVLVGSQGRCERTMDSWSSSGVEDLGSFSILFLPIFRQGELVPFGRLGLFPSGPSEDRVPRPSDLSRGRRSHGDVVGCAEAHFAEALRVVRTL